jgi:dolichol-phosphate mannosyltransferase
MAIQVSVMTPVYNERDNLGKFIPRLEGVLSESSMEFEIIIIDDNSPDGTGELAETLAGVQPYAGRVYSYHR